MIGCGNPVVPLTAMSPSACIQKNNLPWPCYLHPSRVLPLVNDLQRRRAFDGGLRHDPLWVGQLSSLMAEFLSGESTCNTGPGSPPAILWKESKTPRTPQGVLVEWRISSEQGWSISGELFGFVPLTLGHVGPELLHQNLTVRSPNKGASRVSGA